jgi:GTP-binding protein HflX
LAHLSGDFEKLRTGAMRDLQRLERLRIEPDRLASPVLVRRLCELAAPMRRVVAVMVDRRGRVSRIAVGDAERVWLPDLGRIGGGAGATRGLRLVVAYPPQKGRLKLPADLRTDMTRLRLDGLLVIEALATGGAGGGVLALPSYEEDGTVRSEERDVPDLADVFAIDFSLELERIDRETQRQVRVQDIGGPAWALVGVHTGERKADEARMVELRELAETAGITVVHQAVQRRRRIDPRTILGKGRLEDLVLECLECGAEGIILDREISPRQLLILSKTTDLKILDRTQLILEIFARHARSAHARTQVELAQLRYSLPRLVERHSGLSRLEGGVGGRGPGETSLEVNRRRAQERLGRLEKTLKKNEKHREVQRKKRRKDGIRQVAVVGYTNTGKSTLLNALTRADVLVEDQLFATLDTTTRIWHLRAGVEERPMRERAVVLSDTVGFIEGLPKGLVEAFRSTLEEARQADLLLHVIDDAHPRSEARMNAVDKLLEKIGCGDTPVLLVRNQCDRSGRPPGPLGLHQIRVSALHNLGLDDLASLVTRRLLGAEVDSEVDVPWDPLGTDRY